MCKLAYRASAPLTVPKPPILLSSAHLFSMAPSGKTSSSRRNSMIAIPRVAGSGGFRRISCRALMSRTSKGCDECLSSFSSHFLIGLQRSMTLHRLRSGRAFGDVFSIRFDFKSFKAFCTRVISRLKRLISPPTARRSTSWLRFSSWLNAALRSSRGGRVSARVISPYAR